MKKTSALVIVFLMIYVIQTQAQYSYQAQFPEYNLIHINWTESEENQEEVGFGGKLLEPLRTKPGYAFFGSALVPGLSQAANDKWVRASVYVLAEVGAIVMHQVYLTQGRANEKKYRRYINTHWSVQKYAEFLVAYHNTYDPNRNLTIFDLAAEGANLTPGQYNFGTGDWDKIDVLKLRALETQTPFNRNGFNNPNSTKFTHPLPDYNSQQYYELVAKYYQFSPGWGDFNLTTAEVDFQVASASPMFLNAADQSTTFNDQLRTASRLTSVILLNHVVSAFDAYFTVKLKNFEMNQQGEARLVTGASVIIPF